VPFIVAIVASLEKRQLSDLSRLVLPARLSPTVAATAKTTAAAARRLWTSLVHGEVSAANLGSVERVDRVLSFLIRAHFDESESTSASGRLIAHYLRRLHRSGTREQLLQLGFTHLVRQISNIQLSTHHLNLGRTATLPIAGIGVGRIVVLSNRLNFRRSESRRLVTLEDGE
jgi:hypothetical protein